MVQIKFTKSSEGNGMQAEPGRLLECRVRITSLENGETVKRGCGRAGLIATDVGWHCFYCGNYIYQQEPTVEALWFHFKIAREYWRVMSREDKNFINGIPVSGFPDFLPRCLLADLAEACPPKWFRFYLIFDEEQFQKYLETQGG